METHRLGRKRRGNRRAGQHDDLQAAILMVANGSAASIRLAGFRWSARMAPSAIATAQAAGVDCVVERGRAGEVVLHILARHAE